MTLESIEGRVVWIGGSRYDPPLKRDKGESRSVLPTPVTQSEDTTQDLCVDWDFRLPRTGPVLSTSSSKPSRVGPPRPQTRQTCVSEVSDCASKMKVNSVYRHTRSRGW